MATVLKSFAISGIDGYVVNIEIDTIYGKPSVSIVGMGDTAIKEARERLEAAIINSKFVAREWLRPSQEPPGVLKFSSGKLKLRAKCSNYEYLAF